MNRTTMPRFNFELDYSDYILEHFPMMEQENARLARNFANTVEAKYKFAENHNITDEDFRILMNNALCDFIETGKTDLL